MLFFTVREGNCGTYCRALCIPKARAGIPSHEGNESKAKENSEGRSEEYKDSGLGPQAFDWAF